MLSVFLKLLGQDPLWPSHRRHTHTFCAPILQIWRISTISVFAESVSHRIYADCKSFLSLEGKKQKGPSPSGLFHFHERSVVQAVTSGCNPLEATSYQPNFDPERLWSPRTVTESLTTVAALTIRSRSCAE